MQRTLDAPTRHYFAPTVEQIIDTRGLKRAWIAQRLGVSPGHLTHMLRGRRTVSDTNAQVVADLLGVPVFILLSEFAGRDDCVSRSGDGGAV